ncbi:right-handed parallel beta-helix repeat-containing protein [Acanthopleuribacter pedis]|uniref:Right-handed parallel beta-helix repeat-containing protein n=1 Tax=Acanthopleuribacter pedis TaxID=442870 RepID=A0A8J7Q4Q1_9BACT|nr:right-handed parallel beta-helix repeat-containing protein [Acanthopleuribacter pedis]MBO1317761.1 right-handed parallel beta-helix repeat-containing protein [Acanthopleuribacter pedis]
MQIKDELNRDRSPWAGLLLWVLGMVAGAALVIQVQRMHMPEPADAPDADQKQAVPLNRQFTAPTKAVVAPDNGLINLRLTVPEAQARILQNVRDRAMERGLIIQEPSDQVPVTLELEGKTYQAECRIKGDLTDHVAGNKWSFRLRLQNDKWRGKRVFSIQNPMTRGYLWEWLVHEAARDEGVLAPRSLFVNLVVNGNPMGIYFLEEHFAKEMVESQGRREGPLLLFNEASFWSTYLRFHRGALGFHPQIPIAIEPATGPETAEVRAYGEKRFLANEALNRTFAGGIEKMLQMQDLLIAAETNGDRLQRLHALQALKGTTIEQLIDVDRWGRAHALASLYEIWHGMVWHNMRMYANPVSDRLEPVMYDNMAHALRPGDKPPVPLRTNNPIVHQLNRSTRYRAAVFRELGRMLSPAYLDAFFAKHGEDLARYEAALRGEGILPPGHEVAAIKKRLYAQQIYLDDVIHPGDAVNFSAHIDYRDGAATPLDAEIRVEAWATTQVPLVIEGFEFSNGVFLSARACLPADSHTTQVHEDGSVGLALKQPVVFRFPADRRLANLDNVRQIKEAARATGKQQQRQLRDPIQVRYRLHSQSEPRREALVPRSAEAGWLAQEGRPTPPSLKQALDQHPFLNYQPLSDRLAVLPGTWQVKGDLMVPRGYPLHFHPGVTLQFEPEAVFFTESALFMRGTAEKPIVLEPQAGAKAWRGLLVLGSRKRSELQHVVVRNTDSLARKGWQTTGGVTFYHADVTIRDSTIEGTLAEDGTNLFGCEFLMERVTFTGCASDSMDGDFVKGEIIDCVFRDGLADGADFSGSDVRVVNSTFHDLGDKGLSVGENTRCQVENSRMERVAIGLAAKDLSVVTMKDVTIDGARHYGVALYVKKAEYGPSRVTAEKVTIRGGTGSAYLVQHGSSLTMDGRKVKTEAVDVSRMYREQILGN